MLPCLRIQKQTLILLKHRCQSVKASPPGHQLVTAGCRRVVKNNKTSNLRPHWRLDLGTEGKVPRRREEHRWFNQSMEVNSAVHGPHRHNSIPGRHTDSNFPLQESQVQSPPTQPPQLEKKSSLPHFPLHNGDFQSPWAFQPQPRGQQYQPYDPKHDRETQAPPPVNQDQDRGTGLTHPQHQEHPRRAPGHGVGQAHFSGLPKPGGTKPIIWLGAVFCAILWIVIFLGGLIVLVVYLVYRPRSPRFDVSSATLNTAYIDAGSLLNADLSVLANFTNPNKKVSVDFSYMVIDLYYGSTLIATQYIEPFSAERAESRFVNVHMVTSQVRLPVLESERLQEQISKNGAIFAVKGVFRVRSKLGTLLKYSYRLYGHCTILVTAPPDGVLRATKCRTKR
ncbi:hypothetical protein OIU84_018551 [Salix udensis]|uniref:Late embryogenesis abundant protein LEA-2 subgroup domain-containing protein n=1 Tax=Salix udensis TaxID=889485 RepID=A0AAD6KWN8_9ROSI|nr:hypothetical protein OIU84_018551 [Salix udensis]